ncbi:MAG TPA: phosphoribosylamine--glycine ligase [Vicinamibacterales bacterium]|nr:phosphoribosylamine--glycine ligase [Vicinamibacterales bacterium]
MKILVVGAGAREHALVWKLASEPDVSSVLCAPGNPGIGRLADCRPVDPGDVDGLLALADAESVDLTIVGPELPLSLGLVDRFTAAGRMVFGPTAEAARLETSKIFAKEFCERHRVPTARFRVCDSADAALDVIRSGEFGIPAVIKADGLAAGKGVVIAGDRAEAEAAVRAAMVDRRFGAAGARIVIEEHLQGQELSFFVVADGHCAVPLLSAQDHKRAFDDDEGPNTGGMGAFAPSPLFTPDLHKRIMRQIIEPVLEGMAAENRPYSGFLYAGLMLTADGPQVIEFNARLGDPEAQVVLPMIDEPLLPLLAAAVTRQLRRTGCRIRHEPHVGVVLASGGYPGPYATGHAISGITDAEALDDVLVFQAGTAMREGRLVTAGGRVLTVVGRGPDYRQAIARAYEGVAKIEFDGMQFRRDIGRKALAPASSV